MTIRAQQDLIRVPLDEWVRLHDQLAAYRNLAVVVQGHLPSGYNALRDALERCREADR